MKVKELTQLAMLIALTVLLGVVPNIGIIQIGAVSLTILHIPVIIAAMLFGVKGGTIVGLAFGLTSWFVASTRAVSPIDLLFVNPLVSVLPRLLFGILTGLCCKLLLQKEEPAWKYGAIGFVMTFVHSLLVYTCMYMSGKELFFPDTNITGAISNFIPYILTAFSINALLEAAVAAVLSAILMKSLKHLIKD